jgi:hypothetical protein
VLIQEVIFGWHLEEPVFNLGSRGESYNGVHITLFEDLLQHAGVVFNEFYTNIPENFHMIQFCMLGRRYGEITYWGEYESYMIFNVEELIKLHNEIRSILELDVPWQLDGWRSLDVLIDHINVDLLSPVERSIREKRWLIGAWG